MANGYYSNLMSKKSNVYSKIPFVCLSLKYNLIIYSIYYITEATKTRKYAESSSFDSKISSMIKENMEMGD